MVWRRKDGYDNALLSLTIVDGNVGSNFEWRKVDKTSRKRMLTDLLLGGGRFAGSEH
jgi:hypothetical protein